MAAVGKSSFGLELAVGDGLSPEGFTAIAGVRDTTLGDLGNDSAEVTAHDSATRFREFVPTLRKEVTVGFELTFDSADATQDESSGLLSDLVGTIKNYRLTYTDTGALVATFPAYIESFSIKNPVDGAVMADVTLKVSGAVTLA